MMKRVGEGVGPGTRELERLFQLEGVGVVQTDLKTGRFVRANRTFCELLSYREAELRGMSYGDITHPEDRERDTASFGVLQRGELASGSSLTRCLRKDGQVVWLELYVTVAQGEGGERLNLTVVSDATERKRAEAALRGNEQQFRALVTATSYALYRISPDWTQMRQLDGRGFVTGTKRPSSAWLSECIHPDDQPQVMAAIEEGRRTKSMFELEHRVVRLDGSLGWTLLRAVPLLDDRGEITEWFGAASDVTGRKRSEEALRESEERYRILFNSMDEAYAVVEVLADEQGAWNDFLFLEVNPAFVKHTGAENPVGHTVTELLGTPNPRWAQIYAQVAATGEPVRLEELEPTLGRVFDLYVFLLNGEGRRRVAVLFTDITERKRAEAERERLLEELRVLNETLEQQVVKRTEELRLSQTRFVQAFNAGPVATCITTLSREARQETFLEVNEMFKQLTGYEREETLGRTAHELGMWSLPEDQRKLEAVTQKGDSFHNLELKVTTKAGVTRDVLLSAEVIRLDGEHGYLKLFYDVTEQRRSEEQLYRAIQEVMSDTAWFSRSVMERLAHIRGGRLEAAPSVELTQRERQVLAQLAQGRSNETIAAELGLATQTVRNYISTVYDKLGVHSRAEAVVWARERGIT